MNLLKMMPEDKYDISLVTVTGGVFAKEIPDHVKYHQIIKGHSAISKLLTKLIYKMPPKIFDVLFLPGRMDVEIAYMHGFPTKMISCKCKTTEKTYAFVHGDFSVHFSVSSFYKTKEQCFKEYEKFTRACFVSEDALRGFRNTVGNIKNGVVIHNVIDFQDINRKAEEAPAFSFKQKVFRMVSVGRLDPVKAFDRLIRIVKKLEDSVHIQLVIAGDGPERRKLEDFISETGCKSVFLTGFLQNPYPVMAQADLYVCSSLQEAYSTSVAESVGLGVPVLTTKCAGMHEILDGGACGIVVENDEKALFDKIQEFIRDPDMLIHFKKKAGLERDRLLSIDRLGDYAKLF